MFGLRIFSPDYIWLSMSEVLDVLVIHILLLSVLIHLIIVSDRLEIANILNKDLDKIRGWAGQWKMAFNLDPTKQAQEVVFSKKPQESFHPNLYFNKFVVEKV